MSTKVTRITIAIVSSPGEDTVALWTEASTLWNEAEDEETQAIWESCHVKRNAIPFIFALHEKGFNFLDKDLN